MSLQEQADATAALLLIQELIDAKLIELNGEIDSALCHSKLVTLESRGVTPNPDIEKIADLGWKVAAVMGYKLL
jgi:hypothetical protein